MNDIKTDSGDSAKYKSHYTAIKLEDRDWIDQTKGNLSRVQRLHEVIQKYRGEFRE